MDLTILKLITKQKLYILNVFLFVREYLGLRNKNLYKSMSMDIKDLKFEDFVHTLHDSVIVIDKSGQILHINEMTKKMFGYSLDDIKFCNVSILMPEPYKSEHHKYLENYKNGKIAKMIGVPRELVAIKKNGEIFNIELNVSETNGYFIGIIRDISNRIEQQTLINKLRASNLIKDEYLSRVSHELRTPLNSIIGFSQLMELFNDYTNDEARKYVHFINKSGNHLLALINDILNLSKLDTGKMEFSLEVVNLLEVVKEVMELGEHIIKKNNVYVCVSDKIGENMWCKTDKQKLIQVFLNLLSNGCKFNQNGTLKIDLENNDGAYGISFIDSGIGLTENQINNLFIPFDRLGAEELNIEGTGLGLVLSKSLIEKMDGSIGVQSKGKNMGASFTVWLKSIFFKKNSYSKTTCLDDDTDLHIPVKEKKVLYIEDNVSNYVLIESIMKRYKNVTLYSAIQGSVGLELAKEHHPDVILLDLHLPDTHGLKVLDELRKYNVDSKVIIVTADASRSQIEKIKKYNVEYLTKPINISQFHNIMMTYLN